VWERSGDGGWAAADKLDVSELGVCSGARQLERDGARRPFP
jgi:hypothetical protein